MDKAKLIDKLNDIVYNLNSINSNICVNYLKPGKQITKTELNIIEQNIAHNIDIMIKLIKVLNKKWIVKN